MYTVDHFISFFKAIPEENFLVREYGNEKVGCSMGLLSKSGMAHCEFGDLLTDHFGKTKDYNTAITINNGDHPDYQQPTPKQRILAALYDIKKLQQPVYEDITKSLAVLPTDETADAVQKVKASVATEA